MGANQSTFPGAGGQQPGDNKDKKDKVRMHRLVPDGHRSLTILLVEGKAQIRATTCTDYAHRSQEEESCRAECRHQTSHNLPNCSL